MQLSTSQPSPNQSLQLSAYDALTEHLAMLDNVNAIADILDAILTDKEQAEINNRIRIFELIDAGMTQRDISDTLGVGIATVSRGAKAYREHHVTNWLASLHPDLVTPLSTALSPK